MRPIVIDKNLSLRLANMAFIEACLIVSLHVKTDFLQGSAAWWVHSLLTKGIAQTAVPFFFLASGFFLAKHMEEPGWYIKNLRKKFNSLLLPYVYWNFLYWLLACLLKGITSYAKISFGAGADIGDIVSLQKIIKIFGLRLFESPQLTFLWFLKFLVLLMICAPATRVFIRKKRGAWLLGLLFVIQSVVCMYLTEGNDSTWNFTAYLKGFLLKSCFYFSLGVFLRYNPVPISGKTGSLCFLLGGLLTFLTLLPGARNRFWLSQTALALKVPLLLVGFWKLLPPIRLSRSVTSTSFLVYVSHDFFIVSFSAGWRLLRVRSLIERSLPCYFLQIFSIVALCVLVVFAGRRICPGLLAALSGDRAK